MTWLEPRLQVWIGNGVAKAIAWTLLHSLWEGAAIAVMLALVLVVARSVRVRYAASCFAMLALLVAFGATFLALLLRTGGASSPELFVPAWLTPMWFPSEWLAPLWVSGVLLFELRALACWMAANRLRRIGVCHAAAAWAEKLDDLRARLRVTRTVTLLESCLVRAPLAIGHLKPAIVVPIGLLTGLPSDQIEAILLHELAHIRRADYLLNLLQTVMEGLLFYHPAAWWISGVIRAEREHCCDDMVIATGAGAHEYALALAAVASNEWITMESATAATGGNLVRRVRRLLHPARRPGRIADPLAFAGVLVTACAAFAAWPAPVHPEIALAIPAPVAPTVLSIRPSAHVRRSRKKRAAPSFPVVQTSLADAVLSPFAHKPFLSADPFEKWLDEASYIISPEERASFEKLRTDRERNEFIKQFWLWRPEYLKIEHYRRIAYANERFGTGVVPGWKTDRGRIYIMYGPPDEIETHPWRGPTQPASEHWLYRNALHPGFAFRRSVDNVVIEFIDRSAKGDYRILSEPDRFISLNNSDYHWRPRNAPTTNRAFFSPGSGSLAVVEITSDSRMLLTIPLEFPARQHTIAATTVSADGKTSYEKLETEVPCRDAADDAGCRGFYHATASAELPPGSYVFSAVVEDADKSLQKTYVVNFSVGDDGGSLLP